jgi:hypothetical protein
VRGNGVGVLPTLATSPLTAAVAGGGGQMPLGRVVNMADAVWRVDDMDIGRRDAAGRHRRAPPVVHGRSPRRESALQKGLEAAKRALALGRTGRSSTSTAGCVTRRSRRRLPSAMSTRARTAVCSSVVLRAHWDCCDSSTFRPMIHREAGRDGTIPRSPRVRCHHNVRRRARAARRGSGGSFCATSLCTGHRRRWRSSGPAPERRQRRYRRCAG